MWKTFWFEGNMAFGKIESRKDWVIIVNKYKGRGGVEFLRKAQENPNADIGMPSFGFYIEHDGPLTLGRWADKNKVNLNE